MTRLERLLAARRDRLNPTEAQAKRIAAGQKSRDAVRLAQHPRTR